MPCDTKNIAEFRVRRIDHITEHILPIFDHYPLLTSKYFNYIKFKEGIQVINNFSMCQNDKDKLLTSIKNAIIPKDYISPAWETINYKVSTCQDALKVITKAWIIGFTEAEGSFYLVKKGPNRITHAFEITQKLDVIVLEAIAKIFGMKVTNKKTYNCVVTTKTSTIQIIVDYYFNTIKGIKSLEYRI